MNGTLIDFRLDTLNRSSSVTIAHDCDPIKSNVLSATILDWVPLFIPIFEGPNMTVSNISSCICRDSFILSNLFVNEHTEEYYFANELLRTIKASIRIEGIDIGIRYMLKTLNKSLLNSEYGKCNTFLQLVEKNIPQFDLRLHICVLTITSHWKMFLSSRSNYFLSVEKFALNKFEATRVKQMLSGLE